MVPALAPAAVPGAGASARRHSRPAAAASPTSSTPCSGKRTTRRPSIPARSSRPRPSRRRYSRGQRSGGGARRRHRGAGQGRQGCQHAVGEPVDRRARHRHSGRQRLYAGRFHLPRLPGELREERHRVLAGRRSLPAAPRPLGGPRAQAAAADVRQFIALRAWPCVSAISLGGHGGTVYERLTRWRITPSPTS